jgi:hypothetical protein
MPYQVPKVESRPKGGFVFLKQWYMCPSALILLFVTRPVLLSEEERGMQVENACLKMEERTEIQDRLKFRWGGALSCHQIYRGRSSVLPALQPPDSISFQ